MSLKQHRLGRVLLSALATSVLAGAAIAGATPALATTSGSLVVADQTVAPGGTITATLTPIIYGAGSGDYAYYCDQYAPTDTSTSSQGGHSTVLLLIPDAGDPTVLPADISMVSGFPPFISFSGPGEGSFTPYDNVTTPTTLTFTLPSDIPDGVYQAEGGCVSPQNWGVQYDNAYFTVTTGLITVSSSTPTPTPTPLPDTGVSNSEGAIYGSVAAVALTIGIALVLMRRRSRA